MKIVVPRRELIVPDLGIAALNAYGKFPLSIFPELQQTFERDYLNCWPLNIPSEELIAILSKQRYNYAN